MRENVKGIENNSEKKNKKNNLMIRSEKSRKQRRYVNIGFLI